jgi:K+-transporting ATPase ATPase C chain
VRAAVVILASLTFLTGVVYPLLVTAIGQTAFRSLANGSLVLSDGRLAGSALIGQAFDDPAYFWGRLSATGPSPYNAGASSGSNWGPLNPALRAAAQARIAALRAADPRTAAVPVDLVTASGSGLDPHVTPAAALWQVSRVARARGLPEDDVRGLVEDHIEERTFGVLGEPRVNVLALNLALDELCRPSR